MNKMRTVLCVLIALALMVPLAIFVVPAVRADSGEPPPPPVKADSVNPQEGAEVTLAYDSAPSVEGDYYMTGKCVGYGWAGEKLTVRQTGYLHIVNQDGHNLQITWEWLSTEPDMSATGLIPPSDDTTSPQMQPPGAPFPGANGYVGCIIYDTVKIKAKNKPRLSSSFEYGTYGTADYHTGTLNAQVKVDKNWPWPVKSIKGRILAWYLGTPSVGDGAFSILQWEYKFTATPL